MANPYSIPWLFDYTVVLGYLGYVLDSDFENLTVPFNNPSDHSGYDQVIWLSGDPQPTWTDINSNAEAAGIAKWIYDNPYDYQFKVLQVDKQNKNALLTEVTQLTPAADEEFVIISPSGQVTSAEITDIGKQMVSVTDFAALKSLVAMEMSDIDGLEDEVAGKVDKITGKGLSANDYTSAEKTKLAGITTQSHIGDGATNAATNAPTSLNVVTTLLGTLTGEVNATNTKQNDLATKYNDLATKFNTLLDRLEANGFLAAS